MNEEDFIKRDSFSISLLNILDHFYIDYDQKDEFGIIEKYIINIVMKILIIQHYI